MSKRIVIVGGGSFVWVPNVFRDIALTPELAGCTVVLQDIDPKTLPLTLKVCKRIIAQLKSRIRVVATTSQTEALRGADFVIVTISTGGFDTMEIDVELPKRYGIYQSVGDTVGPGGIGRALRNIPVFVGMARNMERVCPDAWMLNYTNPMSTLCRAVTKTSSIRTVGLCHEVYGVLGTMCSIFGLDDWRKDMIPSVAGVNHFSWITGLRFRGQDGLALLREYLRAPEKFACKKKVGNKVELTHPETHLGSNKVKFELFKIFGVLPGAADRHLAEFMPQFLTKETHWGADWGVELTTIEQRRREWHPNAKKRAEAIASGATKVKKQRSGEAVSLLMAALAGGAPVTDVVNIPNVGQIPELPLESCVETMGVVDASGIRGLPPGPLSPGVASWLRRHVENQEMTVEAALTGDRALAYQAFVNDPMTLDLRNSRKLFDEMLEGNKKWLPQFFKKGR
jgi:alpha-galactosidase/6-phospho-beta-glucosidase family protein